MAKESSSRQSQLRQMIAQQAARLMAEDGVSDYAFAKRKAARQLGIEDARCLPGNAEIESELRWHQETFQKEDHPAALRKIRSEALVAMEMLDRFSPLLTGSVLDGTAGKHAETEVHLFADSDKDVEIFLLNNNIPYQTSERYFNRGNERRKVSVLTLEGPSAPIRLTILTPDDARLSSRSYSGEPISRASRDDLAALLETST